ncbi:MAG: hypothetical protein CL666_03825 [Balneola sp.]|nr:hypothetical protein [Balneola sp.]|tara:strand:- start:79511 stop:81115 length:1605 start_codon:yes stop_codon:yes gene_type:complete
MAGKVIAKNESILPFFGDRMTIIGGLDPLGNQNTSDATFQMILPGLNNVTGRLRYYSYYCWLLDQYSERVGSTDPAHFRRFIRKAEYLTALAAQLDPEDTKSISGSTYAGKELNENNTVIKLNEGIYKPDGDTEDTYWKFPLGIFGQYYLGSMRTIGLLIEHATQEGLYIRTESSEGKYIDGKQMAEAFGANLSEESVSLFFRCMDQEEVTKNELEQLLPDFSLTTIPQGTDEIRLLTRMLIQKDYPRSKENTFTFRSETIKYLFHFLEGFSGDFEDRSFIQHSYFKKGLFESESVPVLTGWYFYQFNEYWQYACSAVLNGVLTYLQEKHAPDAPSVSLFIDQVTEEIIKYLEQQSLTAHNATLDKAVSSIGLREQDFAASIHTNKGIDKAGAALQLLLALYKGNKEQLKDLKAYGKKHDLLRNGAGVEYFLKEFESKTSWDFNRFLSDFLLRKIILRHQFVAFRKMGNGNQSTQKFILEEHTIRYLGRLDENYTGPRIGNLIQFLIDAQHLTKDYELTDTGKSLKKALWDGTD